MMSSKEFQFTRMAIGLILKAMLYLMRSNFGPTAGWNHKVLRNTLELLDDDSCSMDEALVRIKDMADAFRMT